MRLMVGTDGSESADRAVDFAARLAKELRADLQIVHVLSVYTPVEMPELARQEKLPIGEVRDAVAMDLLKIACQRAESVGVTPKVTSLSGDVAERIITLASANSTDVIVLGKRGRGRLQGVILGSVSQKITCHAPCAVIVVP